MPSMTALSAARVTAVVDVGIGVEAVEPCSSWGRPIRRVMSMAPDAFERIRRTGWMKDVDAGVVTVNNCLCVLNAAEVTVKAGPVS